MIFGVVLLIGKDVMFYSAIPVHKKQSALHIALWLTSSFHINSTSVECNANKIVFHVLFALGGNFIKYCLI